MDIQLPELDGYKTAKLIKENEEYRNIPMIAVSAHAKTDKINKYKDVFNDYLTKPIKKGDLIKSILKFI